MSSSLRKFKTLRTGSEWALYLLLVIILTAFYILMRPLEDPKNVPFGSLTLPGDSLTQPDFDSILVGSSD